MQATENEKTPLEGEYLYKMGMPKTPERQTRLKVIIVPGNRSVGLSGCELGDAVD